MFLQTTNQLKLFVTSHQLHVSDTIRQTTNKKSIHCCMGLKSQTLQV